GTRAKLRALRCLGRWRQSQPADRYTGKAPGNVAPGFDVSCQCLGGAMTVLVKMNVPSGTIVLNRPEKRNALSRQMLTDIAQAFDDLHQERKVRAVILTGAGTAFCAGMDLAEMQQTSQQPDALSQWHQDAVQYREVLDKMLLFPKPIIAAVNGPVMAGGAGLMLASDIVIAAPEAKFGLPEPRRGIVAGIVSPLLTFRIGASHAANLLL